MYEDREALAEFEALAADHGYEVVYETESICSLIPQETGVLPWKNILIRDALEWLQTH